MNLRENEQCFLSTRTVKSGWFFNQPNEPLMKYVPRGMVEEKKTKFPIRKQGEKASQALSDMPISTPNS